MKLDDIPWFSSDGRLSMAQRWRMALGVLRRRLQMGRAPRVGDRTLALDPKALDGLAPPPGPLALAALGVATRAQPDWLLQHSLRTYAWAALLGMTEGCRFEATTLYTASLLHDLGLTDVACDPPDHCFAVRGARAAMKLAEAAGASRAQAATIAACIATHLDLTVAPELGVEARLLQAGAAMDVLGSRAAQVPPPLRRAVIERHPRLGMKAALCRCMAREAEQAPATRIALYVGRFHFLDRIRQAPFDE